MTAQEKTREEEKRRHAMGASLWENIEAMTKLAESLLPPEQRRNRPRRPHPMQLPRS